MFRVRKEKVNKLILPHRDLLIEDIEDHLLEYRPEIGRAYPRPYLRWVINDSLDIAATFELDDVQMLRVFVRLRWEIAPGFYKQPDIARVLANRDLTAEQRFETLAAEAYAAAWEDAGRYAGPEEWRSRFWSDES